MKAKWSSEDLITLEQSVPKQGIQGAADQTKHSLRETYELAVALDIYVPPNGVGPWPRRSSRGAAWPIGDEQILRQEYVGHESIASIADLLGRSPQDVEAMTITLALARTSDAAHKRNSTERRNTPPLTPMPLTPQALHGKPQNKSVTTKQASSQNLDEDLDETMLPEPFVPPAVTSAAEFRKAVGSFLAFASNINIAPLESMLLPIPDLPPRARWTQEKDDYLKQHYHSQPVEQIADQVGMTYYQTTSRARRLKVANTLVTWTREETIFLLEHIQTEPLPWVAEQLGRTMAAVSLRPKQLGIFPGWTGHDDQLLLRNLGKKTNAEIGKLINRPEYAVDKRVRFLKNETSEFSRAGLSRLFESKGKEWVDGLVYLPVRPAEINKRKWTSAEIEILREYYPKKGSIWCAAKLGMLAERIRHKAQSLGLHSNKVTKPWNAEDDAWLLANVHTLAREKCAKHLKRSVGAVSVRASVLGAFKIA